MTDGSAQPDAWTRAKFAAALFAVDPLRSGVSLRAAPGPARDAWLELLRDYMPENAPIRRAPLVIADDRLLGGLDLAATLRAGRPIAETGLLAQTHGGVLVLAMAERHSSATAARIVAALDTGRVELARTGLADQDRQDAHFGVVALDEGQDTEERPPAALLDRLAFQLDLATVRPGVDQAQDVTPQQIAAARTRLAGVVTSDESITALVAVAARLGVKSLRAPLLACRVARAACALRGARVVEDSDLEIAARYVLAPRATCLPAPVEEQAPEETQSRSNNDPEMPQNDNLSQEQQSLHDVVVTAACAALPPDMLARLSTGEATGASVARSGHSGAAQTSTRRGRPLSTRRGALRDGRLSLIDTLRVAAPWQSLRAKENRDDRRLAIQVRAEDFRITRFRERRETTAIFVVDASGSSARQRLAEVKGAIELMLADCYVRRDSVALIAFRGKRAEIVLPPTRSLARAKRLIAAMPGGGGTPLAHGLDMATTLAESLRRKGQTPLIALLTDGRANIDRDGSPGRARALEDALQAARRLRLSGYAALAIDSSPVTSSADGPTRRIADAMQARYLRLPYVDAARLSAAIRTVASVS